MSSQLVDLNSDNHHDILVGSFSGVPQIIMGLKQGYSPPQPLKDKTGQTVLIGDFWNRQTTKWDKTDRAKSQGHCTSVSAVDWDQDGDLDLLLGDYQRGHLFYRLNEGTPSEPRFSEQNFPVIAGGKKAVIKGGLAAPRIADFDDDGLFDILCGGTEGGVFVFLNEGRPSKPQFKAPRTLIKALPSKRDSYVKLVPAKNGKPTMPGSSYHIEPVDYDQDGDLDLLVGGKSTWLKENVKTLTAKEQAELDQVVAKRKELMNKYNQFVQDFKTPEERKKMVDSEKYKNLSRQITDLFSQERKYKIDPHDNGDFVWLYRRQ